MLRFKTLTMKNFMSIGAVCQTVKLNTQELNLVLGENLDLGGDDNRNGVGKSTILNALSYVLYDAALTKIRKDNLVNKTNSNNMYVTLEFDMDGTTYKLERGRKPNKLKFFINNHEIVADESDESQGDSRVTQRAIEHVLGLSHTMFKNIVALNTYSEPFLSMRAADQREIIEQLLGITKLSEKAEVLKVNLKDTKDCIKDEEYSIKAINDANATIEKNIRSLELKSRAWTKTHDTDVVDTNFAIEELEELDIDIEIKTHSLIANATETKRKFNEYEKEVKGFKREITLYNKSITTHESHVEITHDKSCPTCGTTMEDDKHQEVQDKILADLEVARAGLKEKDEKLEKVLEKQSAIVLDDEPHSTYYESVDEAYTHRSSIESLTAHLTVISTSTNPYVDQIETLKTDGIQAVDFTSMNEFVSLRDHQDYLLKLLINKDSFVRKRIIDQNLSYLNSRLDYYLVRIGLPHEVAFLSDLTVEITEHGRDLDFDNLSRGERTRLILSLSWAFRDVYESLNGRINLLFIDELMDNGLDTSGVENALGVLKHITRDLGKSIFLISHREELIGRVDNIVKVIKEGGYTSIEDYEE